MKNIRTFKAPKYESDVYTKVEENIYSVEFKDYGLLRALEDEELSNKLKEMKGWEEFEDYQDPENEGYYGDVSMITYEGVRYYRPYELIENDMGDRAEFEFDENVYIDCPNEGTTYVVSFVFESEPELGENRPDEMYLSQDPLEGILDKFNLMVNDFYYYENERDKVNSYVEVGSTDIERVRKVLSIVGKHVYYTTDEYGTIKLHIED